MRVAGTTEEVGPGWSARRRDGRQAVTGAARFTADLAEPGYRHVVLVRSEVAHGRIVEIDTQAAREVPGVQHVVLAADLTCLGPMVLAADPVPLGGNVAPVEYLAGETVRYVGQPVAAVVATDLAAARLAATRVVVRVDPLPTVLSGMAALAPDGPKVYPEWGTNVLKTAVTGNGSPFDPFGPTGHLELVSGKLGQARSAGSPMELRTCQVRWDEREERLHWTGTTQGPHLLRSVLSQVLGLGETQVHVVSPTQGGSFGIKQVGHADEVLVAGLARQLRTPLRWEETRQEALLAGQKEQTIEYRASHDRTGRVHAVRGRVLADVGVMTAHPAWIMPLVGSLTVPSGYDIEDVSVEWTVVVTNKPPWTPARPFGKEIATLLMESVMDKVALATGLDPLEVRRRNWIRPSQFPYLMTSGLQIDSGDYAGLADAVLHLVDYDDLLARREGRRAQGRLAGIGWAFELTPEAADVPGELGGAWDTSTVRLDTSGHVTALMGITSPGNGNDTAIAQIVAAELGVDPGVVRIVQGDTDLCPFGTGNLSSRGVVTGGSAAALAARDVAATLRTVAGAVLGCSPDDVQLADGAAYPVGEPQQGVPVAEVARAALSRNHVLSPGTSPTLESTRTFTMPNVRHRPDTLGHINTYTTYSNGLYLCEVEIDPETGVVSLESHAMAHDCGVVVNPRLVEGQVKGGAVMGLGCALSEEITYDERGRPQVAGFKTYLLPRSTEVPAFRMVHRTTPSPFSLLGTKGAGESGMGCAMAGVLNAVNDALAPHGTQMEALPLTPPRVLRALAARRAEAGP